MADETPTTPMKPQDTVIYILGELGGKMTSLSDSVNASNSSQAAINAANETEHKEFRETLSIHGTQLAILNDGKVTQRYTKSERTQQWMVWMALPASVISVAAIIYSILNK